MTTCVAFLRAVNVGGTGKLPMAELRAMCEALRFTGVRTYIASGNVVFESRLREASVKSKLEESSRNTRANLSACWFEPVPNLPPCQPPIPFPMPRPTVRSPFFSMPPPTDMLKSASGQQSEEIALGTREIYVHYGQGMAKTSSGFPLWQPARRTT